ncbi:MAG: adenine deaminase, partial [Clostridia bacterium]|nr:adenine deaminase [Clostridia bacterium]
KRGVLRYANGQVLEYEKPLIDPQLQRMALDTFHVGTMHAEDFADSRRRAVIGMVPGEIVTTDEGYADAVDLENDILKIAVIERHKGTRHTGLGYLKGYGLKSGAVATSVSHDSHNIIAVGASDSDIACAVNRISELHGGLTVIDKGEVKAELPLEIAGLMSERSIYEVDELLENAKRAAHALGVNPGVDPFMTLSFMSLAVIPTLRLTTRGVIDVLSQKFV